MSVDINIRLWDRERRPPRILLADLVRFLDGAPAVEKPWRGYWDGAVTNWRVHVRDELDTQELLTLLGQATDDIEVNTHTVYRIDQELTKVLTIWAWPADRLGPNDRTYSGDAYLSFRQRRGFVNDGRPNEAVAQNVLRLYELLERLVDEIGIAVVKAHTDANTVWPMTAHFAYFSTVSSILGDLQLIEKLWRNGSAERRIRPLVSHRDELRGHLDPERDDLYETLQELIPYVERVDEAIIQAELAESRYDVIEQGGGGWFVMQFPYLFDDYIDGFYLDVLRRARAT